MTSLSTVEAKLPPGFRFHPKDEELVCNYLMNWVTGCTQHTPLLIQVDLNKCEPWDIPESACVGGKEWYFYSQRDRKYATGLRTNRATVSGYWKATGKDRPVNHKATQVGMRKTLVFYHGRAPKGKKTDWVMHEFRLEGALCSDIKLIHSVKEQDWVLCRMFYKSRSEVPNKQENINWDSINGHNQQRHDPSSSSLSLPPLMEPCNNIIFTKTHPYPQQVPCFSNTNRTQTNTNFSESSMKLLNNNIPSLGQALISYPVIHNRPLLDNTVTYHPYNSITSCDEKVIKDVLSYLVKTESVNDNNPVASAINGSPSFGEGSSESYLSEAGLSSLWNQY